MGFGTRQQIGNRVNEGTTLADLFGNNIGATRPLGTTQQPNQLFNLIQQLLGNQGFSGGGQGFGPNPGIQRQPPQSSGVTAQSTNLQQFRSPGGTPTMDVLPRNNTRLTSLANPTRSLISQQFIR